MGALDGVFAKIGRARDHLKHIDTILDGWSAAIKHLPRPSELPHPKGKTSIDLLLPKAPPLDKDLPLVIGDFVHNLRSALDHLAVQLAALKGTATVNRQLSFPIFSTRDGWLKRGVSKIRPFVSTEAFAAIDREQPYRAPEVGQDPTHRTLWILQELDNIDKHRVIVVVSPQMRINDASIKVGDSPASMVDMSKYQWRQMEDGATVVSLDLRSFGPNGPPKMHVQLNMSAELQFANTNLLIDGEAVRRVLPVLLGETKDVTRNLLKNWPV